MLKSRGPSSRAGKGRLRPWRNVLFALVAVSLFQYISKGEVTWPAATAGKVRDTIEHYAARPEASWRKATTQLEELGKAKEGQPTPEFGITGRVVRVADGDTISVLDRNNTQYKIRMHGIDTPEREQRYGKAARDALLTMVDEKTVGVVVLGKDQYGRIDGTVYLGDSNINLAMVAGGHAWWYRHYAPDDRQLQVAEELARTNKQGLWAQSDPMPPWDWRRQQSYGKP
mgnify:CR=1 FL=1